MELSLLILKDYLVNHSVKKLKLNSDLYYSHVQSCSWEMLGTGSFLNRRIKSKPSWNNPDSLQNLYQPKVPYFQVHPHRGAPAILVTAHPVGLVLISKTSSRQKLLQQDSWCFGQSKPLIVPYLWAQIESYSRSSYGNLLIWLIIHQRRFHITRVWKSNKLPIYKSRLANT